MDLVEAAFEKLFQQHYTALVMYACKWLRRQEEAEEAVQDVFVNIWKKRESLNPEGNLKAYLFTATRNRCISILRKRRQPIVSIDTFTEAPIAGEHNIEAEMDTAELRAAIYEEIRQLPDKCKEVFLLSRRDGMSYKQIANHLGLSIKTVENHIGAALKRIRQRLFRNDDSPWKGQFFSGLALWFHMGFGWASNIFETIFEKLTLFESFFLGARQEMSVRNNRGIWPGDTLKYLVTGGKSAANNALSGN